MIAIDTNILVYAHRGETRQHEAALTELRRLAAGPAAWAIPVFVLSEFLRVTTHLRVFSPPTDRREAVSTLDALLESPSVRLISPGARYWGILRDLALDARADGNDAHDAAIAAVCLEHGVGEILSEDRGFDRIAGIERRSLEPPEIE